MNERYLFRGKRVDTGEWIIGGYAHTNIVDGDLGIPLNIADCIKHHLIFVSGRYYEIDPATIGQCTGIEDMNGKLIFEGDIVKCNSGVFVIKSKRTYNCLYIKYVINGDWDGLDEFVASRYTDYGCKEIIGNIHDNPELLKG